MKIAKIKALELLDSRGNPTVETTITLEDGTTGTAMVPSGASTGSYEALELRDQDENRFLGKGVLTAVENVNKIIAPTLIGQEVNNQMEIDQKMLDLDGTNTKKKLGANAILSVSIATIKAAAITANVPVYKYISSLVTVSAEEEYKLPIPMMNVLNGGKHAIGSTDFQEFMIMPIGAPSIKEAVRWGAETFHHLGKIIKKNGWATTVGDEGGYAPSLNSNEEPLDLIVEAIKKAGYTPGKDISIALDPATSEIYKNGKYELKKENRNVTSKELLSIYQEWIRKYPIVSIEDGFAEDDWEGFTEQTKIMGNEVQIVGDDLFVTNVERLKEGIEKKAANSILIKLNQIGTVTETLETIRKAQEAGITAVVSHRSGETEDSFIADFVVGLGTGQIKTGSLCRSERICKYNQLIRIEENLGDKAKISKFPFKK